MRNRAITALLAGWLAAPVAAHAVSFPEVVAFATKTGFRAVIAWEADAVVAGFVRYGTSSGNLNQTALPLANLVDRAQMTVIDNLTVGQTIYFRIEDRLTGDQSALHSFKAKNAYTSGNGFRYTIDALMQLDSEALPDGVPFDLGLEDMARGINILAERTFDALDGYARIGKVLVTDTVLNYPLYQPFGPGFACVTGVPGVGAAGPTLADFVVQTTVPFDSHTFSPWSIEDPCTAFYIGRLGQLVVEWQDDLHLGYVMAHEFMHYAFNAPDLYPLVGGSNADCRNTTWDGSLMHNSGGWNAAMNRWELTELDRNSTLTPCTHTGEPWSWDVLRTRYTDVPLHPAGPIDHVVDSACRGNDDGGALEIWILDNEPGTSTLRKFTPNDSVPCP